MYSIVNSLLLVTDHRFFSFQGEVYDDYVFDYAFFSDYLAVYDVVTVFCRLIDVQLLPEHYVRSSGNRLSFVGEIDLRGLEFLKILLQPLPAVLNIRRFNAFCFRIPSVLSLRVWLSLVVQKVSVPVMFELIGDPVDSVTALYGRGFKRLTGYFAALIMQLSVRFIISTAQCGSYVSFSHLQKKYPISKGRKCDSISSIRLPSNFIRRDNKLLDKSCLRIVHVGSFVPIKNHYFLIKLLRLLLDDGLKIHLTLVGDGPLKSKIEQIAIFLAVEKHVTFYGQVVGFANVVKVLDDHDFFIIPSLSEGMPRALIEAMARGLLCFGADRGGISELLDDGFLFDPSDVYSFKSQFLSSIQDDKIVECSRIRSLEVVEGFELCKLSLKRKALLLSLLR